jgi:hypothetical protein
MQIKPDIFIDFEYSGIAAPPMPSPGAEVKTAKWILTLSTLECKADE